jgi:hypothetical protein
MLFADKWVELETIMVSEGSQAQSTKVECFPSYVKARPER